MIKKIAAVILVLLIAGGLFAAYTLTQPSSLTPFNAAFSDLQGYSMNSSSYFLTKVSSTDFTVLASSLATQQIHLNIKSHSSNVMVNASIIDIHSNKTYDSAAGKNVSITINSGAVQFRLHQPSNITDVETVSVLSGPLGGRTLGINVPTNDSFAASLPGFFDVDLDQVGNQTTGTLNIASLSVSIGNKTVINGTTNAGITLRVFSNTTFDTSLVHASNGSLILGQFSQLSINPMNFPSSDDTAISITAPLGRINTSSGSTNLLGVENVQLHGAISSVAFTNDSGRIRSTLSGKSDLLTVDGSDITRKPLLTSITDNLPLLSIVVAVAGLIPLYADWLRRRRN